MDAIQNILVDIGSSTVKVYEVKNNTPHALIQKSIHFKDGFSAENGLSKESEAELTAFLSQVVDQNPTARIKIYATALFRKMSAAAKQKLTDSLFLSTGLYLNIISQELEGFYLEMALVGKSNVSEPILLINIGGGSTELVVVYGIDIVERHFVDIGAGNIQAKFPAINNPISGVKLSEVVQFVKELLPSLENKPKLAIYNGGELTYMRLASYKLEANAIFNDADHPQSITLKNFQLGNERVFTDVSIDDLEALMPHDPKWMHGARGCSAIAQAICEQYDIQSIIPSDSNMAHGITRQELRTAVLSGSFRKHLPFIIEVKNKLENKNIQILSPRFTAPKNPGEEFVVFEGEEGLSPLELERHHLHSIDEADCLIVCDPEGYVGASALIEIGYAHALGKRVVYVEKPEEFMLNTLPAEIGI